MALSKATAGKIIDIVAADQECQRRITWSLLDPAIAAAMPPVAQSFAKGLGSLMEMAQIAGAVHNAEMMLTGSEPEGKRFDELCCAGIASAVVEAIYRVLTKGGIPEIRNAPMVTREVMGVTHKANSFRMQDNSEYVFDWHATLQIKDPAINTTALWTLGARGFNYRFMPDFN